MRGQLLMGPGGAGSRTKSPMIGEPVVSTVLEFVHVAPRVARPSHRLRALGLSVTLGSGPFPVLEIIIFIRRPAS